MSQVFVTVGTDHHRFDRLVAWIDRFATDHPSVSCFVQSGTSTPASVAESGAYLPFTELHQRLTDATAVVSHGGPATIMDARAAGRLPIVVPRQPDGDEHVDDHQVRFCTWMDERRQVKLATDEAHLTRLLEDALAHPDRFRVDTDDAEAQASLRRFGDLIDGLLL